MTTITTFWEENYRKVDDGDRNLMLPEEVYHVFRTSMWYTNETLEQFVRWSTTVMGNISSKISKCLYYNIIPVSETAIQHHKYEHEEQRGVIQEQLWGDNTNDTRLHIPNQSAKRYTRTDKKLQSLLIKQFWDEHFHYIGSGTKNISC